MEYRALYRRYRPTTFSEVVGQQHVTETLAREITEGKVAHAYLFAGPRGTGKTTTARILAKSLNCTDRHPDGTPCNKCVSCTSIDEGSSLDVIELDAASHNSVDDIRDIRVSVSTVAVGEGARRVFILDEAHMLSKAAGNALLKTLEEPPSHVHFVLATTEPYKLLDTIRSRAQRFDFHAIGSDTLTKHLESVASSEGYRADSAASALIARQARGSARDALSLLEQVAALGSGTVDVRGVRRAIGLAEADVPMRLANAMVEQDAKSALELVGEMVGEGVDLRRFVSEAIAFFRGVFLAHYAPNLAEVADEPSEVLEEWKAASKLVAAPDVLRVIDQLGDALIKLREGREERLMIELALLRLVRPEVVGDPASLAARLDRLEQRVKHLADTPAAARTVEREQPATTKRDSKRWPARAETDRRAARARDCCTTRPCTGRRPDDREARGGLASPAGLGSRRTHPAPLGLLPRGLPGGGRGHNHHPPASRRPRLPSFRVAWRPKSRRCRRSQGRRPGWRCGAGRLSAGGCRGQHRRR